MHKIRKNPSLIKKETKWRVWRGREGLERKDYRGRVEELILY
jgi:hypothetical protein